MKTEHMVLSYLRDEGIDEIVIFALPFKNRPARNVAFAHRPDQSDSIPTRSLENLQRVSFHEWDGEENVASLVDVFVIAGAGILDVGFASGKPIVNAHPGIIPTTRGLDSFKWAIFEGDPVGVTVHLIDNEVDKGEILHIEQTPVFATDTLDTLAHRHYEVEMHLVRNVLELLDKRVTPSAPEKPAKMRMPADTEAEMFRRFDAWKDKYSC
jgi:phosphoribosylglycinamide formyltransferase-1